MLPGIIARAVDDANAAYKLANVFERKFTVDPGII